MTDREHSRIDQMLRLDDRPIKRIGWWFEPEFEAMQIGHNGVTKINVEELYCGSECSVFWVQIWKDDQLYARFNARNVDSIFYE